jgi:hypothetical protein
MVEPGKPQITIWLMRFASWIPKFIYTHSECVIRIAFSWQQWFCEHASNVTFIRGLPVLLSVKRDYV